MNRLIPILSFLLFVAPNVFAQDYNFQQLTFDSIDHETISSSGSGEVIWDQQAGDYRQVFSLSHGQLTNDLIDHYNSDINSLGEFVYSSRPVGENLYRIYSNLRGQIGINGGIVPVRTRINDAGEVVWGQLTGGLNFHVAVFSNQRGKVSGPGFAIDADVNNEGEIIFIESPNGSGQTEKLISTEQGDITPSIWNLGRLSRENDNGEFIWLQPVRVSNKDYLQIFSSEAGQITHFYEGLGVESADIDNNGNIYFSRQFNGFEQIFSARPVVTPEPVSSSLFLLGAGAFALKRFRKKR